MKKIIPKFPYVDYEYREADENAVDIQYLINFVYTMDSNLAQRIEEFGVYVPEYENRIQRYRNTLEMAYHCMGSSVWAYGGYEVVGEYQVLHIKQRLALAYSLSF